MIDRELDELAVDVGPGNYYGCLCVAERNGQFYWSVENWDGFYWSEIPESLFRELVKNDTPTSSSVDS